MNRRDFLKLSGAAATALGFSRLTRTITMTSIIYASPAGSDANPGTLAAPVLTMAKALSISSGMVVLRGGTYAENLLAYSIPSNTTVRSFPGERAIIQPSGGVFVVQIAYDYHDIKLQDLAIDAANVSNAAVKITTNSYNVELQNCEVMNAPASHGILVSDGAHDITINGGSVHGNGANKQHHGVYVSSVYGVTVTGVEIYQNKGHAVHIYGSGDAYYNKVQGNNIHDNATAGIGLYYGSADIVDNKLLNNGTHNLRLQYHIRAANVTGNDMENSWGNASVGWTYNIHSGEWFASGVLVKIEGNYIHDSRAALMVIGAGQEGANETLIFRSNVMEGNYTNVYTYNTAINIIQEDNV